MLTNYVCTLQLNVEIIIKQVINITQPLKASNVFVCKVNFHGWWNIQSNLDWVQFHY